MSSARLYALPASLIYSPLTHKTTNILRLYLVDFALIHVVDCCVAAAHVLNFAFILICLGAFDCLTCWVLMVKKEAFTYPGGMSCGLSLSTHRTDQSLKTSSRAKCVHSHKIFSRSTLLENLNFPFQTKKNCLVIVWKPCVFDLIGLDLINPRAFKVFPVHKRACNLSTEVKTNTQWFMPSSRADLKQLPYKLWSQFSL